ncbi:luciferase family oxidoreductase, group 1 [Bradyrhizobium sp. Rc3b]|nr:luciferase family oxidoreductase, group 1 [Bradyrhizobium sp. Rc3b]
MGSQVLYPSCARTLHVVAQLLLAGTLPMIPFSVLDLAPICQGGDAAQAFRNSLDLARHAEGWGFKRFWLAEHHNMTGIASAATSVVIGHIAGGTKTIRVGSGGIMLPNHSPLVIAEQFGTLESLYPGRIDLGLGRAPGTDQFTARALRRDLATSSENFPHDVLRCSATCNRTRRSAPCPAWGPGCRSGFWDRAPLARSSPRCWACRSPSPRISRRR